MPPNVGRVDGWREGEQEVYLRVQRRQAGGRGTHERQRARHLFTPAAGQEPHHARVLAEAELAPRRRPVGRADDRVEDGMADELDRHTRPPVDRGLEGEHGEHQRDAPADRLDASAAPRPDLRRDEVDDRHAGAARRARQAQVELGKIDDHEDTRPASALEDGPQAPVRAVEHRHAAHRLARAGGGGRRHVDE